MSIPLTPRARVEKALRGGHADKAPFTMYECMIPQCSAERQMRNNGLCIVQRTVPVYRTRYPNVREHSETYFEQGKQLVRTYYETPAGTLTVLDEPAGFTVWHHEKMFKRPEDYKPILSLINDERYEATYDVFAQAEKDFGEDAIFRPGLGLEPLQTLISGNIMAMETFCAEWMERRDEVLRLYAALVEKRRELYPIIAGSPASHVNYGGNVVPEIIGLENFQKYYVPHYNEAAEIMHRHGKLIGSHLDANCRLLAEAVAGTDLDYIEAFTPAPDTDLTLSEARKIWKNKVIWLNFPSSTHLKSTAEIEAATIDLLDEAGTPDGILMGITENMPLERWQGNCLAIMQGLDRHSREHPQLYR